MEQQSFLRIATVTILMALIGLGTFGCNSDSSEESSGRQWGTAGLIETDNAGNATNPQVVFDADGNAVAVWQQSDGTRTNIWSSRYTAATGLWDTPTMLDTEDLGNVNYPQVAIDADGDAVAVWQQYDGTNNHIWTNRYTASTGLWGTPALLETDNTWGAYDPQLAIDAGGNVVAVWVQDSTPTNIWTNRYTASTGLWGTPAQLEMNAGYAYEPQVAIDADGNAVVVWHQDVGYPYNIWSNRYTAATDTWSGAARIESNTAGNAVYPSIAVDADGNAVAVWQQYNDVAGRYDIWANHYTTATGWGTAAVIETGDAGWATAPQVAIDADGNAVAVWHQSDGTRTNIWTNRYTAGTGWGTAEMIETDNTGDAINPQIAIDADGNAVAVWYQSDGTRDNIWSNRYTAETGWGTAEMIETDNTGGALAPQVAFDADGNAVAVWQQSDGTRANIWSNMYR